MAALSLSPKKTTPDFLRATQLQGIKWQLKLSTRRLVTRQHTLSLGTSILLGIIWETSVEGCLLSSLDGSWAFPSQNPQQMAVEHQLPQDFSSLLATVCGISSVWGWDLHIRLHIVLSDRSIFILLLLVPIFINYITKIRVLVNWKYETRCMFWNFFFLGKVNDNLIELWPMNQLAEHYKLKLENLENPERYNTGVS